MSGVFSQTISSRGREADPAAVTLLEILVVLAIVATLAGLVLLVLEKHLPLQMWCKKYKNLH